MQVSPDTTYSLEWFQQHAFASLKKLEEDVWDYTDSLLLYATDDLSYSFSQQPNNAYVQLVTQPEQKYLKEIAPKVAKALPPVFEYIDLGPGTAHKEQYLFDECKRLGKRFTYRPVDINLTYLHMANDYAAGQGIISQPIQSSFEDLAKKLKSTNRGRFVSLGQTYGNYAPKEILPLLKTIAGSFGKVFIDVQIRNRIDISAMQNIYAFDMEAISGTKLKFLGLDPTIDVAAYSCDDGIRMWTVLRHVNPRLEAMGIKPGTKLMTFMSLRPSLEQFKKDIGKIFPRYKLLDMNQPYVGAILG